MTQEEMERLRGYVTRWQGATFEDCEEWSELTEKAIDALEQAERERDEMQTTSFNQLVLSIRRMIMALIPPDAPLNATTELVTRIVEALKQQPDPEAFFSEKRE